jgi:chromosome segregation ATPase
MRNMRTTKVILHVLPLCLGLAVFLNIYFTYVNAETPRRADQPSSMSNRAPNKSSQHVRERLEQRPDHTLTRTPVSVVGAKIESGATNQQVDSAKKLHAAILNYLAELDSEKQQRVEETTKLQSKLKKALGQISSLNQKLHAADVQLMQAGALQQQVTNLQRELETNIKAYKGLQTVLNALKDKRDSAGLLQARLRELQEKYAGVQSSYSRDIAEKNKIIDDKKAQLEISRQQENLLRSQLKTKSAEVRLTTNVPAHPPMSFETSGPTARNFEPGQLQTSDVIEAVLQNNRLEQTKAELEHFRKNVSDILSQIASQLESIRASDAEHSKQLQDAKNSKAVASRSIAKVKESGVETKSELDGITGYEAKATQKLRGEASRLQGQLASISSTKATVDATRQSLEGYNRRTFRSVERIEQNRKERSDIAARIEQLEVTAQSVNAAESDLTIRSKSVTQRVRQLQSRLSADGESIITPSNEFRQLLSKSKKEVGAAKEELNIASRIVDTLSAQSQTLKSNVEQLRIDISIFTGQESQSRDGFQHYRNGALKALSESDKIANIADIRAASDDDDSVQQEYRLHVQKGPLERLAGHLTGIRLRLHPIEKKLSTWKPAANSLRESITKDRNTLPSAKASLAELKQKLDRMIVSRKRDQEAIEHSSHGFEPKRSADDRAVDNFPSVIARQLDYASKGIEKAEDNLNEKLAEAAALAADHAEIERTIEQMKTALTVDMQVASGLKAKYDQLAHLHNSYRADIVARKKSREAYQDSLASLRDEISVLRTGLRQLASMFAEHPIAQVLQQRLDALSLAISTERDTEQRSTLGKLKRELDELAVFIEGRQAVERSLSKGSRSEKQATSKAPKIKISKVGSSKQNKTNFKFTVPCDLRRVSCRKWVHLKTKQLERQRGASD